ncbi:hypothetical protein NJ7G_1428 [Natrinema sp. J7-2]|nr:hypothetical protein NJ7G_1428 [Natrinema sp. J7-2]
MPIPSAACPSVRLELKGCFRSESRFFRPEIGNRAPFPLLECLHRTRRRALTLVSDDTTLTGFGRHDPHGRRPDD